MPDSREGAPAWVQWWWARCVAHGVAVDAMGEPIGGNVAVDQRIALDLRVGVDRPQAQSGSGCQHNQRKQPSAATS